MPHWQMTLKMKRKNDTSQQQKNQKRGEKKHKMQKEVFCISIIRPASISCQGCDFFFLGLTFIFSCDTLEKVEKTKIKLRLKV